MRLLISRPSVFVWGPEACLSNGLRSFRGNAHPLRTKTVVCGSVNLLNYHTQNLYPYDEDTGHYWPMFDFM